MRSRLNHSQPPIEGTITELMPVQCAPTSRPEPLFFRGARDDRAAHRRPRQRVGL